MSLPAESASRYPDGIEAAHMLVDLGVPVFVGRLTRNGDPDRTDRRWSGWQRTSPSHTLVDSWRKGLAICAVTGITYDVIDYDPRNGGEMSIARLQKDLGEDGPEIYWRTSTPSGGQHLWVSPMNIGSHNGIMPGIDLKGGKEDGSSRGFVFLPPTIRPSKPDGNPVAYVSRAPLLEPHDPKSIRSIRDYFERCLEEKSRGVEDAGIRAPIAILKQACLAAEAGEQRTTLLQLVHEWERKGYEQDDIIELLIPLVEGMPVYDEKRPWYPAKGRRPDAELRSLLHRAGDVSPDAVPGELDGIGEPARAPSIGLTLKASEVPRQKVKWLWKGYLPFRELVLLDGEKGQGKTFVVDDICARITRGLPMPGEDTALIGPSNVLIFTDEGHLNSVGIPRLIAAGADLDRVFFIAPPKKKRGKVEGDSCLLPDGARMMSDMIRECDAVFAVWDPITDFLAEDIQTHNDASVRRALRPLAIELAASGASGLALRHMNKDSSVRAKFRGGGTTAFQNRARVHLVTGELPSGHDHKFGVAMVDTNMSVKVQGTLTYSIVDSTLEMDEEGSFVGKVEWGELEEIHEDELTSGPSEKRGPHPTTRNEVVMILEELFQIAPKWPQKKVMEKIKEAGLPANRTLIQKAKTQLGIQSVPERRRGANGGTLGWYWVLETAKVKRSERSE